MQRRGFFLALAFLGSALAQAHPPEILRSPTPMVEIDTDASPSPPINGTAVIGGQQNRLPNGAFVSVSDLSVPERVRKEFQKAGQSFARQNWTQARDRLNKAISLYPSYAGAYNDLAVAYSHLGDIDQERRALEKAIALDDRYALAQLNLGRMDLEQRKLPEAEAVLGRAAALAPEDPKAFILLAYCQLLQKHFDNVIATSNEAHKLSGPHAFVHRVAARAFEGKRQFDRAATELNIFLQEEPAGPAAEAARRELQAVQADQHE